MPALDSHMWTADDVRALPSEPGKQFECVDGELLVSPGPRLPHQSVQFLLIELFAPYCRSNGIGAIFTAPGELELDRFTLVQPDVFILPLVGLKRPQSQDAAGHPLLFVEILSPSTARYDRVVKRARYQRFGVEYWIADLDARVVERWTPGNDRPEIVSGTLTWQLALAPESLAIDLPPLFAEALGE